MAQRKEDCALVLEDLSEEENISAILRTAEAFGVGLVCIVYTNNKKPQLSKNISSGAKNWLNIEWYTDVSVCLDDLKNKGFRCVGAVVDPEAKVLWEQSYFGKIAVIVGNEAKGLSEIVQASVDENIYLPMLGLTESLNVSVAAGIFLYEVIRQKEKSQN